MRILMIADYLPYPLIGGDRVRIYNLLCRIARHHEVSFAAFLEKPEDIEGVAHLKQFCANVEVVDLHRQHPMEHLPGLISYVLQGKPPELKFLHSEELVTKIQGLLSKVDFDIVQFEHAHMALYLETLPRGLWSRCILMFHNFAYQQDGRIFKIERRWDRKLRSLLNSFAMLRWEPQYSERFGCCTTVSENDRDLLCQANPKLRVEIIPNGVDTQKYQPLPENNTPPHLLFIGNMRYSPCVDAALYFCREIFSLVRRVIGSVELWIVGRDPHPEVLRLHGNGIHVTGRVEDAIPYYRRSKVSVVPLRAGGGTRLKILEAMALGRPVVSTTIGCEGLDVVDGEHLLIADHPEQFAAQIVRLLTDSQLYQHISVKGRQLVKSQYDWDRIAERLMDVYAELLASESS